MISQRRFAGYLFDLDGTLVDTAPDIEAALNAALGQAGLQQVTQVLTRHWVGHGSRVLIEQALTHQQRHDLLEDEAELAAMVDNFFAHYRGHIADHSMPYPGTNETLEGLRDRGARLAVVTNKLEDLSLQLLDALDLSRFFDVVVGADTLTVRKPDPEPALHALAHMSVEVRDALFIGDSATDVNCARAAGCAVVCVRDGYNHGTPAEELGADAVIDSLTELI